MKKVIFLLVLSLNIFGQSKDPYIILNKVKENFSRVKDYKVDALIKVDMDFLKVPDMKAIIYYKQPNKLKMDSKEFAMLPKQAFNFSPTSLLDKKYNALFIGQDKIDGRTVYMIKVIPASTDAEIIISTLWIDKENFLVRKVESTTKKGGTTQIELKYDSNITYSLPSKITFHFDTSKLPRINDPRVQNNPSKKKNDEKVKEQGSVIITYSNYKINQGLQDSFFQEKKK